MHVHIFFWITFSGKLERNFSRAEWIKNWKNLVGYTGMVVCSLAWDSSASRENYKRNCDDFRSQFACKTDNSQCFFSSEQKAWICYLISDFWTIPDAQVTFKSITVILYSLIHSRCLPLLCFMFFFFCLPWKKKKNLSSFSLSPLEFPCGFTFRSGMLLMPSNNPESQKCY